MPVTVRRIRADEGRRLRNVRLAALADAPSAFGSTHAAEAAMSPAAWDERAAAGAAGDERVTFLAVDEPDGAIVGLVGGYVETEDADGNGGGGATDGAADGATGGATHGATGGSIHLVSMWTAPSHRRTGAGRALVEAVLDWAATSGASAVTLWVTRGNEPAERLYRSLGFEPTGEVAPLPSDPCKDELRMIKRLTER